MALVKTYSPDNKFRFACPVFGAEVEIAGCLKLRQMVAIGGRPEERRGCQVALRSSKCPIPRIMSQIARKDEDPYYAAEQRVGQLKPEVLDHIRPILVHEPLMDEYGVPQSERELLLAANERTSAGVRGGGKAAKAQSIRSIELEDVRDKAPAKHDAATERAAMTGDMSAAITKAAERAPVAEVPESPASKPEPKVAPSLVKAAPLPSTANVAKSARSEIAKSLPAAAVVGKKPSLLELARMRRAS